MTTRKNGGSVKTSRLPLMPSYFDMFHVFVLAYPTPQTGIFVDFNFPASCPKTYCICDCHEMCDKKARTSVRAPTFVVHNLGGKYNFRIRFTRV